MLKAQKVSQKCRKFPCANNVSHIQIFVLHEKSGSIGDGEAANKIIKGHPLLLHTVVGENQFDCLASRPTTCYAIQHR